MKRIALALLLMPFAAQASEFDVNWINVDATRTVTTLKLCEGEVCVEYPASCAPGATCTTRVDMVPGPHSIVGYSSEDATLWSDASNTLDIITKGTCTGYGDVWTCDVMPSDVWRFDVNGDGSVTTIDFGRFLSAFMGG